MVWDVGFRCGVLSSSMSTTLISLFACPVSRVHDSFSFASSPPLFVFYDEHPWFDGLDVRYGAPRHVTSEVMGATWSLGGTRENTGRTTPPQQVLPSSYASLLISFVYAVETRRSGTQSLAWVGIFPDLV